MKNVTSNVKVSVPSRMYGLFPWEWTGLAEITLANFRTISLYFTLYCVLHKITVIKMLYRVNFLVDGLYNITIWRKNAEY